MSTMIEIDECLKLPETVVQSAVDVFNDCCGIEVSIVQCADIIKTCKTTAADLYASGYARDTCTREYLINALVKKIMGRNRRWPMNGDGGTVYEAFCKEFAAAATQAGYKLVD